MTLTETHPKLVSFIQQLTQQPRVLSYREISKNIKIYDEKVSVKTIQHWMNTLKGPDPEHKPQFFYFPAFYYEAIGLTAHQYWGELPQNMKKWCIYSVKLHDYKKEKQLNTLLLPSKNKKMNFLTSGKTIYNFDGTAQEKDYDKEIEEHFKRCEALTQLKTLRKNPLIIPCIFEYQNRATNAQQVWKRFKEKAGKNLKYYCPKTLTDQQGVHAIRRTIASLQALTIETRVEYLPYNSDKDYYYITTKKICANELHKNTTMLRVYKTREGFLNVAQVEPSKTEQLLTTAEKGEIMDIKIILKKKSEETLRNSKFTHIEYEELYDPKTGMWESAE